MCLLFFILVFVLIFIIHLNNFIVDQILIGINNWWIYQRLRQEFSFYSWRSNVCKNIYQDSLLIFFIDRVKSSWLINVWISYQESKIFCQDLILINILQRYFCLFLILTKFQHYLMTSRTNPFNFSLHLKIYFNVP